MIDSSKPKAKSSAVNVGAMQVATVYAKAFLGAAETAGQTDVAMEELNAVGDTLAEHPKLEAVFGSALIEHDEKCQILDRLFQGKLTPLVLDFLKVVARHGRLDIVRAIQEQAQALFDQLRGRIRVQLQTAAPVEDGLSKNLEQSLRKLLGGEPLVEGSVNPDLIGGIVLRVGDTVYDGSVARQLRQVREQMITRSIHEIQSRRDRFGYPSGN